MSRKSHANQSKPKQKAPGKKLTEFEMEIQDGEDPVEPTPRRRLRKLADINADQEFIAEEEQEQTVRLDSNQDQKYQHFQQMDDQDLQREVAGKDKLKRSKKKEGNQDLKEFITKNQAKASAKKEKEKPPKKQLSLQLNIEDMMRIKSEKKKNRKDSQEFINDSIQSQEIDEERITAKRITNYEMYNGVGEDEAALIQKAMQLSLSSVSHQERVEKLTQNIKRNMQESKKETERKAQEQKNKKQKVKPGIIEPFQKEEKGKQSKSKPKVKEARVGPLSHLEIVLTGEFEPYDKNQLIELIQQLGGSCPKSLTKKCTTLLQGAYVTDNYKRKTANDAKATSKSREAIERGNVQIVANEDIDDFFQKLTGKTISQHFQSRQNPLQNLLKPIKPAPSKFQNSDQTGEDLILDIKTLNKMKESRLKQSAEEFALPWTEKYSPKCLEQIIGQQSQTKMLRQWLRDWQDVHFHGKKKEVDAPKGMFPSGTINSKAALLSGDPGLGKTTAARLIAVELHYQVSEFNASDVRNKSGVNILANDSHGINAARTIGKSLIIMDEVDGMSNGDRGGITALIERIKCSKVPIICICNDRSADKIRSLAGHCFDIKFHKPNKTLLVKRLKQIVELEGGSATDKPLERLIEMFQNDVRQILSYLELLFKTVARDVSLDLIKGCQGHMKDSSVMINHFQASRRLLNRGEFARMTLRDRLDSFFVDSDLVPLMIHENYLGAAKKNKVDRNQFSKVVKATEGFVIADMLDRNIRKSQDWELMPSYGFMACIYPTEKVCESVGFPQFASWLGKFSTERKNRRYIKQLKIAFGVQISGSTKAVKYHYSVIVLWELVALLKGGEVEKALELMLLYGLTPTLLNENLLGVQFNPDKKNLLADVASSTKAKLTKAYNRDHGQAKLKQSKVPKLQDQRLKFNPILEEAEMVEGEEEEQARNDL